jgi:hypothetical protein
MKCLIITAAIDTLLELVVPFEDSPRWLTLEVRFKSSASELGLKLMFIGPQKTQRAKTRFARISTAGSSPAAASSN